MKTKTFKNGTGAFSALQSLAVTIQTGTPAAIADHIRTMQADPLFNGKPQAQSMLRKLAHLVATNQPAYSVFALKGNEKLPFVAFSSLPGVTCPGAGACLEFCYSYRAWRFAHSFGRMAQNAYLMRFNKSAILESLDSAMQKKRFIGGFDLRLYVDGDFDGVESVDFWMRALSARPSIKAYGYSKSFAVLLGYDVATSGKNWPANYQLNISSGHDASPELVAAVKTLPIVRGEFIALSIGRTVTDTEWNTKPVNDAVRAAGKSAGIDKLFVCPGRCGSCTPKGHACGSARFAGIPIAIAMH